MKRKSKSTKRYEEFINSDWYKEHITKVPKHLLKSDEQKKKIFDENKLARKHSYLFYKR